MNPHRSAGLVGAWALLGLLLGAVCGAQQDGNLVANPGFESGLDGWEVVNPVGEAARVELIGDGARAGQHSLDAASSNDQDLRPVGVRQTVAVEGGQQYLLSVQARNTALKSSGGVRLTVLDGDGNRLSQSWPVQLHNWESGWGLVERSLRVPGNAATAELLLAVNGLGEAWFDEVSLTRREAVPNPAEQEVEQMPAGISVTRYPTQAPVMKLRACDLEGDGTEEVLIGDIEGGLHLTREGKSVWRFEMGGLPCDIACGDMDGDGRKEVAVATMDAEGNTYVVSAEGERIWAWSVDDNRCSRVAWADLRGDGTEELLIGSGPRLKAFDAEFKELWELDVGGPRLVSLAAGDLDGDGRDEVLAGYSAQTLRVVALDDDGQTMWRHSPPDWPGSTSISSLLVADIDGDGTAEIVGAGDGNTAFALKADGTELWRTVARWGPRETYLGEPIRYTDRYPGTQILLMARRSLSIRAGAGPRIFSTDSGITIIDSAASATEPGTVYLASSGTRDPAFYRLRFSPGGANELAGYALPDAIGEQLDEAYRRVSQLQPLPGPEGGEGRKFHVLLYRNSRDQVLAAWELLKARNTPNVEYEILSYVKELPVELHRFPMSSLAEILDYARFFEGEGVPFWLFVDHGCRPWIKIETARQILAAAPKTCRGFYVAEDTSIYAKPLFYDWLEWAGELLEVCHEAGKRLIFKQMFDCWSLVAADRQVYEVLFKYPETIIPMYATNNGHAPEIQVGGMVGLWRAGACQDWGMSSQDHNWNWAESCNARVRTTSICPPDVILRMDLAAAALGCTYFHVEGGQRWLTREGKLEPEATRHRELLYQLMEQNLIAPARPDQLEGLSPVVVARTTDLTTAPEAQIGTPRGRHGTLFREGLLGVRASMQTPPAYYLGTYAYGVRRYFDGLFPATPYGYLQLLPGFLAEGNGDLAQLIYTDTNEVTLDGKKMWAEEARPAILSALEEHARELPFRSGEAFLSAQKWREEYRLVLVDPDYLNPTGATAVVQIDLPQPPVGITDLLSGESIEAQGESFTVEVPPGGFRLLAVRPR